ncbi:MAG: RNA-binding domain-containing protein [Anaerolineaceae bacterium]
MGKKHNLSSMQWRNVDLHLHTPASSDFQQPEVTYLDILQRAENRGLDVIAFTDHNTVAGYRRMQEEIQQMEWLEKLNRMLPDERARLAEYRRLTSKILVLPGFEFTATFGFHILALFSPDKPIREIEHLLLTLNIPTDQVDDGSATVGATTDVISVYRLISQAEGLVIAAHANSSNGVAMRGFTFGGQTKIAYTQDANLNALEVTDLEQKGGRTTAAFFNGTKPEYPRRMHCIQGSDCHRLTPDPVRKKNLGLGERTTDLLLPEVSFEALYDLFRSNDFSRTRPHRQKEEPVYDYLQTALDQGANIIQDFHENMTVRGGKLYAILADVCAFANTNGGTLFIGLSGEPKKPPLGVPEIEQSINLLEKETRDRITPDLPLTIDINEYRGKKIIRVLIPRGSEPPYALDDNKIYVRDEAETGLAVRDEIVSLVMRGAQDIAAATPVVQPESPEKPSPLPAMEEKGAAAEPRVDLAPRTGVEVLPVEEGQAEARHYTMRDLRNGNMVKNVTKASARRLWHYAITRYLEITGKNELANIQWEGDFALTRKYKQGKATHFDFVQRTPDGIRYYFGVTEDGIHGPWKKFAGDEEAQ